MNVSRFVLTVMELSVGVGGADVVVVVVADGVFVVADGVVVVADGVVNVELVDVELVGVDGVGVDGVGVDGVTGEGAPLAITFTTPSGLCAEF